MSALRWIVDFCAQPTAAPTTGLVLESPPTPCPVQVDSVAGRMVTQDEFNVAASEPGAFVEFVGGRYRLTNGDDVLVLDVELVVA